jgi:hypothetical protein
MPSLVRIFELGHGSNTLTRPIVEQAVSAACDTPHRRVDHVSHALFIVHLCIPNPDKCSRHERPVMVTVSPYTHMSVQAVLCRTPGRVSTPHDTRPRWSVQSWCARLTVLSPATRTPPRQDGLEMFFRLEHEVLGRDEVAHAHNVVSKVASWRGRVSSVTLAIRALHANVAHRWSGNTIACTPG